MYSCASLLWMMSRAPRRKKISSSKRDANVVASRLGRARTDTVLVKLSMMARASLGFAGDGFALTLKVHRIAGAGFVGAMAREHAVY